MMSTSIRALIREEEKKIRVEMNVNQINFIPMSFFVLLIIAIINRNISNAVVLLSL
jgi:hypothetical protein